MSYEMRISPMEVIIMYYIEHGLLIEFHNGFKDLYLDNHCKNQKNILATNKRILQLTCKN